MITDFYFLDLEFSELRVDSSKHKPDPLPISWNLWLIFIRFQDSWKFQCQSHDHMQFSMCYLLSGLKKKFTKCYKGEPSKGISNTENRFPSASFAHPPPPRTPLPGLCPGPTRGPKRPPLTPRPIWAPPPQHTKVLIRRCSLWPTSTGIPPPLPSDRIYVRHLTVITLTLSNPVNENFPPFNLYLISSLMHHTTQSPLSPYNDFPCLGLNWTRVMKIPFALRTIT